MQYIVTLTSYGTRVEKTAPYAICSLLNQTVAPDKIVLWLPSNTKVPVVLSRLCEIGLEIKFCKDLRSYTKLIPSLQEYPDDVLITADDDVFYPKTWFEQLKLSFLKSPKRIHVHRAHRILFDSNNVIVPYKDWLYGIENIQSETVIFPTGVGGILYPPKSLHKRCMDKKIFLSIAPTADDIWFWAMARLQGTKYSLVKNGYKKEESIDRTDFGLWQDNIFNGKNDVQLLSIIKEFSKLDQYLKMSVASLPGNKINQTTPEISVIMPCYNCEKYVGYAIESILSQTFKNFEFIIINDCSTDDSDNEIRKHLADKRIKYHCLKKNIGNYPARNMGMKMATGKYIAVMDADDIADANRLLLQYEYMQARKGVGCIGSQGYWVNEDGEITGNINKPLGYKHLKIALLRNNFMLHPSLMFRTDLIKKHNLFYNEQLKYAADYDFVTRVSHLFKVENIPERLMKYRLHPKQISSQKSVEQASFADVVRASQLRRFDIILTSREIDIYHKIMKSQSVTKDELEQCLEIFNRLLEINKSLKLVVHKYLFDFFNEILEVESFKYRKKQL